MGGGAVMGFLIVLLVFAIFYELVRIMLNRWGPM